MLTRRRNPLDGLLNRIAFERDGNEPYSKSSVDTPCPASAQLFAPFLAREGVPLGDRRVKALTPKKPTAEPA